MKHEIDILLAQVTGEGSAAGEDLALGATVCPEGGRLAPAPASGGEIERVHAMISGAEASPPRPVSNMEGI